MGEEYAEDKFNLLTICLGKQIVSEPLGQGKVWREKERQQWWGLGERERKGAGGGEAVLS